MHHDIHVALIGGLVGQPGIALIAGTGSSCYGINAGGTSCQTGGFGTILDDGGSAYGLGLGGLRLAVRVADGRIGASALQRRVLDALGLADIRGIVQKVYQSNMSKADIAALATLTLAAWTEGDAPARAVVEEQAAELALLVTTAARRLGLSSPLVTYAGSVLERSEPYRQLVAETIHRTFPTARVVAPELPPVLGALLLAYDGAGVRHDAEVHGRLRETYERGEGVRA
jgi:N-acetylglucosamine kinase-like BadF-type ATPase